MSCFMSALFGASSTTPYFRCQKILLNISAFFQTENALKSDVGSEISSGRSSPGNETYNLKYFFHLYLFLQIVLEFITLI